MDRLPDGSFVALERFFAPVIGPRARITRFAAPSGEGGAVRTGIARAASSRRFQLTISKASPPCARRDGATRIYIVSDNNKSAQQRTLLLAFDLIEGN